MLAFIIKQQLKDILKMVRVEFPDVTEYKLILHTKAESVFLHVNGDSHPIPKSETLKKIMLSISKNYIAKGHELVGGEVFYHADGKTIIKIYSIFEGEKGTNEFTL